MVVGVYSDFGGFRWYVLDPTYPIIKLLNAVHLIKLKPDNDLKYM
jgi:stearoyl-CoA desaturase (delta-9 desaturase)